MHTENSGYKDGKMLKKKILNFIFFFSSAVVVALVLSAGKEDNRLTLLGKFFISGFSYLILYLFLLQFRKEVLEVTRKTLFILLTILVLIISTRLVADISVPNLTYLIPYALIPIIVRTFYDARLALFTHLITILLSAFMVPQAFEMVFINFITGMVAIFTLKNVYRKTRLFFTAFVVIISYLTLYAALHIMEDGTVKNIIWSEMRLFVGNGLLVLLSYPLIFFFEMEFLFLSDTTLLELSDTNQPLLLRLAAEAPGSFQHSLQVANLAEEAARALGVNVLLARAGALYHDIGKIAGPEYFIENQVDAASPHDNMLPGESSKAIINHVRNGVTLARNFRLPVQIIDFIRTHHGTTVAYFFYKRFIDQNPEKTNLEKEFTYPGPKPFTKETVIVMIADAVEASSRTLAGYTEEAISELVDKIVFQQEKDGQFSEAPVTFRDISEIKKVIKRRLLTIYHLRVAYPERS